MGWNARSVGSCFVRERVRENGDCLHATPLIGFRRFLRSFLFVYENCLQFRNELHDEPNHDGSAQFISVYGSELVNAVVEVTTTIF